jgi:hypothetical protein
MAEKEKWYRLTQGKHHHREVGENGEEKMVLTAGDEVMLTDEQYRNMADRFEPVEKGQSKAERKARGDFAPNEPELTPTQPQQPIKKDGEPNADAVVPEGTDTTTGNKKADADKATTAQSGATGAGAAANSTNTQKVK